MGKKKCLMAGSALAMLVLVGATAVVGVANAQAQRDKSGEPPKVGPFTLDAGISVSEGYDDNIFATRNDKVDDFVTIVAPSIELTSQDETHEVSLYGNAAFGRYASEESEHYDDYEVGADGRYFLSPTNLIFGGASFAYEHEERSSPDDVNGLEPTTFYRTQAYLGTANQFDEVSLRFGGTFERLDFDNVPGQLGAIVNEDRNRDLYTLGTRIGYAYTDSVEPFVQATLDVREYDSREGILQLDRDSEGYGAAVGLIYRPAVNLEAEALVGYREQDYADTRLEDVDTLDFGARLTWLPSGMTEVSAGIDREVYETTLSSSSSYVGTTYNVAVIHDIRPDLTARVALAYSDNDYRGGGRNDNVISAVSGLRYYFLPNFYIGADYTYLQRDSSSPLEDYDENLFFIRLGADLTPGYQEAALADAVYDNDLADGFYLGVQAGIGNLSTELAGNRGAGGTLLADFGNLGGTQGAFAGYDFDIGNWRLGLEAEAELGQSEWDHTRAPGGRVFSVEKESTYGGALRLSRVLMHGDSVYGRFGVVRTTFDTDYRETGLNVDQDETLTGMRFGGGIEAPIAGGLLARMDYTFTSYEDYDVPTNSGPDNFANNETLLRVGLAYRFGQSEPEEPAAPADYDGFYFGLQGGYGNLHTDVVGARNAGSTLQAEFSDDGALGGFYAGFGQTFGDVYLGVEADGEISDITWDHERDPTGRTYSVQREGSVGGSLRLGYVVNDSALLYLRGGGVLTSFETKFDRGTNSARLSELEPGWRVGGGIETPMTEHLFLRMDYSYAAYDGYDVDYVSGQDRFDNSESLLRVGVAYRF